MLTSIAVKIRGAFSFLSRSRALMTFVLSMLILSMLITSSLAWFVLIRQTGADNIGMGLSVDDTTAVYKAYMYDHVAKAGTDKSGDGSPLTIENLILNQYDTIFKSHNRYTPAFALIQITRNNSMPESGSVTVSVTRSTENTEGEQMGAYSSSITRFTAFIIKDKSDTSLALTSDPAALYDFINSKDRYNETNLLSGQMDYSKTFVNIVGEGDTHTHEKLNEISLTVPYTADCWYKDASGNDVMNVYLYITYDTELIDCYIDKHEEDFGGISLENSGVNFENDFKKVTVGYTN